MRNRADEVVGICDKCGQQVLRKNSALQLVVAAELVTPVAILVCAERHLLPTSDCEGSPSRSQYLEGQPRDGRGYDYKPELESLMRAAFIKINAQDLEE